MIVESITGGLILLGIIALVIKNKSKKSESPKTSSTLLPIPKPPKRDSPN